MLIQIDNYRTIELPESDKWKYYVVQSELTSNDVKIVSKHKTRNAAIDAAKGTAGSFVSVIDDGVAISRNAFYVWKE
jgi:hypothetical protein